MSSRSESAHMVELDRQYRQHSCGLTRRGWTCWIDHGSSCPDCGATVGDHEWSCFVCGAVLPDVA